MKTMKMSEFAGLVQRIHNVAAPQTPVTIPACMEAVEARLLMSGDAMHDAMLVLDGGGTAFATDGRRLVVTIKAGPEA